jgi:hypothetical protein
MSNVKITTNNVPRPIIDASQLSMSAKAEFYYLDWPAIKEGNDSASFFRYKGQLYDLGEFQRTTETQIPIKDWAGYFADSFFSGLLVKYVDDESIIVGTYYVP